MAIAHEVPRLASWLSRVMTTDFCPWANRFLYWLKEPIGWFVLATAVSVMVGLYLSPIGWTLAASLSAIMVVGMAWPLVAVYVTTCELRPEVDRVHEDAPCRIVVSVRNRVPVPVWGLAVEGYLDCEGDELLPTVGLACVPPLCISEFGITVKPPLRGHYPIQTPRVACSFPFGIWTARRKLTTTESLTVWPKVFPVQGVCPIVGLTPADHGDGNRGGRSGDFVGVRAYRRGDSAKHINWVASARVDTLVVTERGGPQSVELDVFIDTRIQSAAGRIERQRGAGDQRAFSPRLGSTLLDREGERRNLAERMRMAASVLINLHQSGVPMRVTVGSKRLRLAQGVKGRRQILDALADVPADGKDSSIQPEQSSKHATIEFLSDSQGREVVRLVDPHGGRRAGGLSLTKLIASGETLTDQVREFWTEVRDADVAA
ncbi:DUF58 domain-containing protein [Novipirellula artificiosorum]|uniref:Uncharacterized protein n=1 Tax=Novipirellula artificiosorum TaxID=2528016 RepID=A0A5C6D5V6_9BACT|nr:DUF58 domain-containing protein [Novipirellula artificiosorum]TWU31121.1 hypothetical protein Poly41_63120 [Novipirellula artificiosorum]